MLDILGLSNNGVSQAIGFIIMHFMSKSGKKKPQKTNWLGLILLGISISQKKKAVLVTESRLKHFWFAKKVRYMCMFCKRNDSCY